jgi:hypothetical protein
MYCTSEELGFNYWQVLEIFFSTASRPTLEPAQPSIQWAPGILSLVVKRQGHEAGHAPPCSTKVKNGEVMPPLLHTSS